MRNLLDQRAPPGLTREGRVALLLDAAQALRKGEPVPAPAGRLLGDALLDWLSNGGSLERDYLRVSGAAGSHTTPRVIALRLQAETVVDLAEAGEAVSFSSRGEQESKSGGTVSP